MFIYTSKDSTTCAEIYIHIYVHMHINVYLYTFMFEYTCIYEYICMYIFIIYIQANTALHALMLQEVERMQEVPHILKSQLYACCMFLKEYFIMS